MVEAPHVSWLERLIRGLAMASAVLGGLVLIAMVIMTVVSIIGRALLFIGLRPITGDYELLSVGMGFAIFAFMPWGHLTRSHALVSLLTDNFGPRVNGWILVITDLMMLVAAAFITWRLYFGMTDKFAYSETTLLLRFPLGWAYAAAFVPAVVWVLVALFLAGRSLRNALSGRPEASGSGAHV